MVICTNYRIIEGDSVKVMDCEEDVWVEEDSVKKEQKTGYLSYVVHLMGETSLK